MTQHLQPHERFGRPPEGGPWEKYSSGIQISGAKKKNKETPEMLLQDNQDIALTDEDKQRLVQSDLQPGQVRENKNHQFHFSEQK